MDPTATKLALVNKALYKISARKITTSLSDTTDTNAVIMNDLYPQCLEEVLEEHTWSFAIQTVVPIPLNPTAWATGTSYVVGNFVLQNSLVYLCAIAHTAGVFATDLAAGDWVVQSVSPLLTALPSMGDGVSLAYALPSDYMSLYLVNFPQAQLRVETLKAPIVTTTTVALLSDTAGLVIKYVFKNDDPTSYSAKFYDALACKLAYEACFKIADAAQWASKMEADYSKALMSAMTADSKSGSPDQPIQNEWFIARLAGSGVVSGLPNGNIGFFPDPFNPDF